MCLFDHSFAHNFFVFHFVAKPTLEFQENKMFFRNVLKSSKYNYFSGRKVLFTAPEVMTEFSVAWYLSIVGLADKATDIRWSVWVRNKFASICITEGSAGAIVAASQIKAVELDFFSTLNCSSSCFLHPPVGDPFYERCNPFNNRDLKVIPLK